jgi:hypothetical protein
MQVSLKNLGLEYAKCCQPGWAENPGLCALILGLNAWGIDAELSKDGWSKGKDWFTVPFRYGPELQAVVAAWNRHIYESGQAEQVSWVIISANYHHIYPVSFLFGDESKNLVSMIEFGNFLLSCPADFEWLPKELFKDDLTYDET